MMKKDKNPVSPGFQSKQYTGDNATIWNRSNKAPARAGISGCPEPEKNIEFKTRGFEGQEEIKKLSNNFKMQRELGSSFVYSR